MVRVNSALYSKSAGFSAIKLPRSLVTPDCCWHCISIKNRTTLKIEIIWKSRKHCVPNQIKMEDEELKMLREKRMAELQGQVSVPTTNRSCATRCFHSHFELWMDRKHHEIIETRILDFSPEVRIMPWNSKNRLKSDKRLWRTWKTESFLKCWHKKQEQDVSIQNESQVGQLFS